MNYEFDYSASRTGVVINSEYAFGDGNNPGGHVFADNFYHHTVPFIEAWYNDTPGAPVPSWAPAWVTLDTIGELQLSTSGPPYTLRSEGNVFFPDKHRPHWGNLSFGSVDGDANSGGNFVEFVGVANFTLAMALTGTHYATFDALASDAAARAQIGAGFANDDFLARLNTSMAGKKIRVVDWFGDSTPDSPDFILTFSASKDSTLKVRDFLNEDAWVGPGREFVNQQLAFDWSPAPILEVESAVDVQLTKSDDHFSGYGFTVAQLGVWAGAGNDKITIGYYGDPEGAVYRPAPGDVLIFGEGGDDYVEVDDARGLILLRGGNGNDTLSAMGIRAESPAPVALYGNAGDDVLFGATSGRSSKLIGGTGDDKLYGGSKNDILKSGPGNDLLSGIEGDDVLLGGPGGDEFEGGIGRDTASYEDATGQIVASLKKPQTNKGDAKGDTYLSIENLTGGKKDDVLAGDDRANVLKGGRGNDALHGGRGKDTLEGGVGKDTLSGGGGGDLFVFRSIDESPARRTWDVIVDFKRKQKDKVDLSAIDARAGSKRNDTFKFVDADDFSGRKGELRYENAGEKTLVYGDVDGDKAADIKIEFSKSLVLKAGDFLL